MEKIDLNCDSLEVIPPMFAVYEEQDSPSQPHADRPGRAHAADSSAFGIGLTSACTAYMPVVRLHSGAAEIKPWQGRQVVKWRNSGVVRCAVHK